MSGRPPRVQSLPALDVVHVLRRLGGRSTYADLRTLTTRQRIRVAVRTGAVVRATRGTYVLPDLPDPQVVAARLGGVVSHASAAQELCLAMVAEPLQTHVTVPPGAHPPGEPGVRLHWSCVADADVVRGITTPLRTVIDCASSMDFVEALAVADSALRRGLVSREELVAQSERLPGRGRRARLRVALAASALAANPFESALRGTLLAAGITGFVPQPAVPTAVGVRHPDLGDEARRILVEGDSFEWHGQLDGLIEDTRRYDEFVRAGWTVLRFAWVDVMFRPHWVADVVRDVCERADARTGCPPRRR